MSAVFALIDCNNFFVSCERIFRPDLEGRPVIVLSSNDGCAVARSNEAKALGIPMGAPAFKFRQLLHDNHVVQFSANFELYGDISERLTRLLTGITPRTEVYSVDESFLDLEGLGIKDYEAWGQILRQRVQREIGLPVSIGIAPSKTLAKLGADRAKRQAAGDGLVDFMSFGPRWKRHVLGNTAVEDIWGVGRKLAPRLKAEAIFTALELSRMRPQRAQQLMGIHGRQMVSELNGKCCHPLERIGKPRQTIMRGRMFGEDTSEFGVVEAAIASLGARAAFSLRREGLLARRALLILDTNRHKPGYNRQVAQLTFATPTSDTGFLIKSLIDELARIFRANQSYHRANVLFYELVDGKVLQTDLLGLVDVAKIDAAQARMRAVDHLNFRFGDGTLHYAAEDLSNRWEPRHKLRSPRYTSRWSELPVARILKA